MILNDILSRLNITLNNGIPSDDKRYSDRYLYSILIAIRAELIKQKAAKYNFLNLFNYQTTPCLSLELSNLDDCDCIPDGVGCKYKRTSQLLPEILTSRDKFLISSVRDLAGNIISMTTLENSQADKHSRLKKDYTRWFLHNNRIYITSNNTDLTKIIITGVFFDPVEVADLEGCADDPVTCYDPFTSDFPIDKELLNTVIRMTQEEVMKYTMRIPQDMQNDAKSAEAPTSN